MRIFLSILSLFILFSTSAQSNQSEFLEAKRLFNQGQYRDAMGAFQGLSDDATFGPHASFYYALSAYNLEIPNVAIDMWKQILRKHANWDQQTEVAYWLTKATLESGRYVEAVKYANGLGDEDRKSLLESTLEQINLDDLIVLQKENSNNVPLARLLFDALIVQNGGNESSDLIFELSEQYGFELSDLLGDFPEVKKEAYNVALVLPFMFDSLGAPQTVIRNRIIFELYQGMLLAQDTLARQSIALNLFPFDTRKSGEITKQRLAEEETLLQTDVIIGPLYSSPNEAVVSFAKEHKIPMINPLSSNESVVNDYSQAYLFKPSYDAQGRVAGAYAQSNFTKNKRAMILFESERDRIVAEAYKEALETDSSFEIVLFDELTKETALQLQHDFTHQYEVILDTLGQEAIDSIAAIPNRFVKTRLKKDEETGRVIKDNEGEDQLEYYEMRFTIPQDTIGHIFAATTSNLLANNIINLTDVRGDSIQVIGYENWLDFKLLSYGQLERLGVSIIHTSLFNDVASKDIKNKIRDKFWTEPSKYHLLGYELLLQLGLLFDEHGKFFQRGLIAGDWVEGQLMEGLRYGPFQSNQVVPIIRLEDLQLTIKN